MIPDIYKRCNDHFHKLEFGQVTNIPDCKISYSDDVDVLSSARKVYNETFPNPEEYGYHAREITVNFKERQMTVYLKRDIDEIPPLLNGDEIPEMPEIDTRLISLLILSHLFH